jgi:hypothetical protein
MGHALAELKLCCSSGSSGSISLAAAAACSVALSEINGCRASSLAGSPLTSPPQVACSPVVAMWPELGGVVGGLEVAQGPDRVLSLVARSSLHFCRVFAVIFIFPGSPYNCVTGSA